MAGIANGESRFGWGNSPGSGLEARCLSENFNERQQCIGYVQTILSYDEAIEEDYFRGNEAALAGVARAGEDLRQGNITKLERACFLSEFYTLRDTALRGYREILELVEWLDTADGKVKTAGSSEFVKITLDFAENIEPSRDAIRKLRLTGKVPWLCRLSHWFFQE